MALALGSTTTSEVDGSGVVIHTGSGEGRSHPLSTRYTHSRGSEVDLKWSFVVRTIDSKERRVRARILRANRMDTAQ